ncbi:MAG: sigma-70 family RNA polymerase sigma factor [Prevotellaceae bacterium]|jgi:RNA polymerase sigma-70 factor (ECF subfamily)|nr:sigma-70 family RNA polymerase sigma factor [Prevotellaceae bacterium]
MNIDREKLDEITRLLKNDKTRSSAFTSLVNMMQKPLYWHIRKMVLCHEDADDLLQSAFMKAWVALDNFRGESQIHTWLFRIATNETLTFLASQRMKNVTTSLEMEEVLLQNLRSDPYFNGDELQERLQEAILTLPEKQRMVFNMKYFEDMKYDDMEKILDTSVGALKASYHHAVKKIENFFAED